MLVLDECKVTVETRIQYAAQIKGFREIRVDRIAYLGEWVLNIPFRIQNIGEKYEEILPRMEKLQKSCDLLLYVISTVAFGIGVP